MGIVRFLHFGVLAFCLTLALASAASADKSPVVWRTDFDGALQHEASYVGGSGRPSDPMHFTVRFPGDREQAGFFLFRLDNVAGKTVRIDMHTRRAHNWRTLNPVVAYIDPFLEKHGSTGAVLADPALFACLPPPEAPDTGDDGLARSLGGSKLPATAAQEGLFQHWHFMPRSGAMREENLFRVE